MIKAILYDEVLEVRIWASSPEEFSNDLERFKDDIEASDRSFSSEPKKVWLVKHVDKYLHIPYVLHAAEDPRRQLTLL